MIDDKEDIDQSKVAALLSAMQAESRMVKPDALGLLGEAHCRSALEKAGADADSIRYGSVQDTCKK
jgi:hypothetical protein